jgi:D-alanine transaminase
MPELTYLNGEIMPIDQARVPVEDRGYQFGDAVYEYLASHKGKLFAVEAHLDRLEHSLTALSFPPVSRDRVRDAIMTTFSEAAIERAGVYLQISRGVAPRNHSFPGQTAPQTVITVRHAPDLPEAYVRDGIRAITLTDIRWGRCDIKTVMLLPNVLAKQQALDAGAQDAIFLGGDGVVREATASNLFICERNRLTTHPLTPNILPGITRAALIDICRNEGIAVREAFFDRETMMAADEVFLSGTVTEVLPVVGIDGQTIGDGMPGPMAVRLLTGLKRRAGAGD